jgi:hypothetical protein
MRAAVLSPAGWTLPDERPLADRSKAIPHEHVLAAQWDKDKFAEEQVRGLVRQVFSPALKPAVQQVLFCPVEAETDVLSICRWMVEILAEERMREVALINESQIAGQRATGDDTRGCQTGSIRRFGTRIHRNLWLFPPGCAASDPWKGSVSAYLRQVRQEFEYSIVLAAAPTVSNKALEMATLADGVVLVVSAQRTRRVMALKVRSALSQARLLGTVLSDREFPMPTSIYRRL